jgi:hypothetical protein
MKRISVIGILSIATLAMIGSAQAQQPVAQAKVPFAFTVGDKTLPADTYRVSSPSYGLILVQSTDRKFAAMTLLMSDSSKPWPNGKGELVFDKYGDQYFLHQIQSSSPAIHGHMPLSKSEKRVSREEASLGGGVETAMVAAE